MSEPSLYTDDHLRRLAGLPHPGHAPVGNLAAEVLALRATLAAIKAADPDLFDPTGGTDRGAAYETYGRPRLAVDQRPGGQARRQGRFVHRPVRARGGL